MSAAELYTKGAKVWITDPEVVWKGAELLQDYHDTGGQKTLQIAYEEGGEDTITIKCKDNLPPLRNPDILIGENDLTSLSYLHEPAVLYNLKVRFIDKSVIYTYCGIVLVAINPYEQLDIYGNDIIQAYSGQDMGQMDPHIYAVAEEAFKRVARFEENQSIIVSGESGAGKTVSAKYAMRYFAVVGGSNDDETQVEKKVLASNPIMEAIGNAKTTRNDNSSRFGKYIEIRLNKNNQITGAHMRTYLLEKTRVVYQASEERNYHIFYQLCAMAQQPAFQKFKLGHQDDFYYMFQGSNPTIDGVDDAAEFKTTQEAFSMLGITDKQQMMIFQIIAAILHFGNINIQEVDPSGEQAQLNRNDKHLPIMCELLGINQDQMKKWLCNRKITTVGETLIKPLTVTQASFGRDALAKHIYAKLFDWIVQHINIVLSSGSKENKFIGVLDIYGKNKVEGPRFIGVLDIYGFETFEINSFEQFCINYANEKLQQQFTLHVFKLEQDEYVKEQIEWSFIDFYDNQPCIDLIENKLGILSLLDEECKLPKGSDDNWCRRLYDKHLKHKHFAKPRMSNVAFIIDHFADKVEYQSDGFLEKNRDTVLEEQLNILKASQFELVADLFNDGAKETAKKSKLSNVHMRPGKQPLKGQTMHKKTVGSQFRDSLSQLMETLFSTNPHYIRCIKPNDVKEAFNFEPKRAIQQLRACGVLETIRISAAGYPSRWTYPEFIQRYRVLAIKKDVVKRDMKQTCRNILQKLIQDEDKYQFGKTKIFFRAGQVAYLEKLRSDKLRACGIMIQKHVRGWIWKRKYQKIRRSVLLVQTFGRGLLARRKALYLRRTFAATKIQKMVRGHMARKMYKQIRFTIIRMQSYARGRFARERYVKLRQDAKATVIQKMAKGWLARRRFTKIMRGLVLVQSHYRRRKAKLQLKILKVEAKSVEHIKNVNKGLENKIIELQQKLDVKNKDILQLHRDQMELFNARKEIEKLKHTTENAKLSSNKISELEEYLRVLKAELEKEKQEKKDVISEKEILKKDKQMIVEALNNENKSLKDKLNEANQRIKDLESHNTSSDKVHHQVAEDKQMLLDEMAPEREHHQRLVKDYERLQQRYDNLHDEFLIVSGVGLTGKGVSRTPSNLSEISIDTDTDTGTGSDKEEKKGKTDPDQGYGTERRPMRDTLLRKGLTEVEGQWKDHNGTVEKKQKADRRTSTSGLLEEKKDDSKEDVTLLLKLQNRIKVVEKEKRALLERLELGEGELERVRTFSSADDVAYSNLHVQELEMENSKIKTEMKKLRECITLDMDSNSGKGGQAYKEFMDQFQAMADELDRRREECVQLRSLMAGRARETHDIANEHYRGSIDIINEDNEIVMAYKTLQQVTRVQENQIEKQKRDQKCEASDFKEQIKELKQENERQEKLIGESLESLSPEKRLEVVIEYEINRLTSENLDLQEENDKLNETLKKYKKALKKLRNKGSDNVSDFPDLDELESSMPTPLKHRDREYMGMLEVNKDDIQQLVRHLVVDLKPKVAKSMIPCLPAYILLMCIRHTDYSNSDDKVQALLSTVVGGIRRVVKKQAGDVNTVSLWLSNTCRLLHNLKQYSGEKTFQVENTAKQNEHCLRNFDLSEYRQILSDLAVHTYQQLLIQMMEQVQPTVVAGILENEAIVGLSGSKPTGLRGRSSSRDMVSDDHIHTLDSMLKMLDSFYAVLATHAVDKELLKQVFRQLCYFIGATALNNLLLRKDMGHWSKGMQIRFNLSHLETWVRDNQLKDSGAIQTLEPIIQASQLLQAKKTDSNVDSICEMCKDLTLSQIVKILNLYTPADEYEEKVPLTVIRKIQDKIKNRKDQSKGNSLLIDTKYMFPVTFPFTASTIELEKLEVPTSLNIDDFVKRM